MVAGKTTRGTNYLLDLFKNKSSVVEMRMMGLNSYIEGLWIKSRDELNEEVAKSANVKIDYQVCDILEIDMNIYGNSFDVVFMEGGILHYFHDINEFMKVMYFLLKEDGKMICSDFHPFTKIIDTLEFQLKTMNYFSTDVYEGEMAHARFFNDDIRKQMPLCSYRKYTMSEIINSVIRNRFILKQLDEHASWENQNVPGEFTFIATKP